MKWNHLPEAGGIYDQNPGLLDRFYFIMAEEAKVEDERAKKQEREAGGPGGHMTSRRPGRGRR